MASSLSEIKPSSSDRTLIGRRNRFTSVSCLRFCSIRSGLHDVVQWNFANAIVFFIFARYFDDCRRVAGVVDENRALLWLLVGGLEQNMLSFGEASFVLAIARHRCSPVIG